MLAAGAAVLAELGLTEEDRVKPEIASAQFITNVDPYQAQLLNKFRKGALLIPGRSLFVLEVAPAAYAGLAANEAEKAATIDVVEIRAVGRFGRVFLAGTESDVGSARGGHRRPAGRRGRCDPGPGRVIGVGDVERPGRPPLLGPGDLLTPSPGTGPTISA